MIKTIILYGVEVYFGQHKCWDLDSFYRDGKLVTYFETEQQANEARHELCVNLGSATSDYSYEENRSITRVTKFDFTYLSDKPDSTIDGLKREIEASHSALSKAYGDIDHLQRIIAHLQRKFELVEQRLAEDDKTLVFKKHDQTGELIAVFVPKD